MRRDIARNRSESARDWFPARAEARQIVSVVRGALLEKRRAGYPDPDESGNDLSDGLAQAFVLLGYVLDLAGLHIHFESS